MSIPAAVFVYILAQNDLFWDKLSLTVCLISNYSWAVLSFENSQPTLGGKILAPIEVQRDETTLLIALGETWSFMCCWCLKLCFTVHYPPHFFYGKIYCKHITYISTAIKKPSILLDSKRNQCAIAPSISYIAQCALCDDLMYIIDTFGDTFFTMST